VDSNGIRRRTVAAVLANGMCSSMAWVCGHVEDDKVYVSVDWTEEEVEVSHPTLLSLLQLSSSLTILPTTFKQHRGQGIEDTIQADHCLFYP
jgi:hypothetical protein